MFIACGRKNTSSSIEISTDQSFSTIEDIDQGSDFSFENATVTDKKGKPEEVEKLVRILFQHNLINQESQKILSKKNYLQTISSNFDIVNHINEAIVWHTDSLKKPFPIFYQDLLDSIFQKENLTEYVVKFEQTDSSTQNQGFISTNLTITNNKKVYSQKVYFEPTTGKIDETFYKLINQLLADKQETNRYYLVRKIVEYQDKDSYYYGTDKLEYALIKLNEYTAFNIHQHPNVIDLSYENHQLPMANEELSFQLKILDSIGLIPNRTTQFQLNNQLSSKSIFDTRDIFYYATDLRKCFSPYRTTFKNVYKEILDSLVTISFQQFAPKKIRDLSQPNSENELSFELNGTTYSVLLSNSIDQIDINTLITTVNKALNTQKIDGNFYLLHNKDAEYCYIFMKENQVEVVNDLLKKP